MPKFLRNILALVVGAILGAVVNMAIVSISPSLIPPPEGVDVNDVESIGKSMHLFEPRHFIMPFLAHALGTFVGALAAYRIAATYKSTFAYAIGFLFLSGGIAACFMIPAPAWFIALDLLVAYIPMAGFATFAANAIHPQSRAVPPL